MACHGVQAVIVSVDYQCGYNVPLEVEVDDCYKAYIWAHDHAAEYGADSSRCLLWGGSAAGALAIAVVHRLVKAGTGDEIAGLVHMNGLTCHPDATPEGYRHLNTSYGDNGGPLPFVSGNDTLGLYAHRDLEPPNTDFNLFPAAGGPAHLKGFPPTYIITSDNDASRDDGTVLEAVLKDAGVRVRRDNIMGFAHYFWTFDVPQANANFWSKLCSGMKWTLES